MSEEHKSQDMATSFVTVALTSAIQGSPSSRPLSLNAAWSLTLVLLYRNITNEKQFLVSVSKHNLRADKRHQIKTITPHDGCHWERA